MSIEYTIFKCTHTLFEKYYYIYISVFTVNTYIHNTYV